MSKNIPHFIKNQWHYEKVRYVSFSDGNISIFTIIHSNFEIVAIRPDFPYTLYNDFSYCITGNFCRCNIFTRPIAMWSGGYTSERGEACDITEMTLVKWAINIYKPAVQCIVFIIMCCVHVCFIGNGSPME